MNVGVTSSGDVFGGSAVTFSDVLGDKQFNLYAASISQYRTLSFSYLNLARRFNYAVQAYSQTQFFYGALEGVFYDPAFSEPHRPRLRRGHAHGARRQRVRHLAAQSVPARRAVRRRAAVQRGVQRSDAAGRSPQDYQQEQFGTAAVPVGTYIPLGVNFVQETTVFREFGPLAGNTMRLSYEVSPNIGDTLGRQTADVDARYYLRLGGSGLLALRARGFKSWGDAPDFMYFGGNSEMRGYEYLEFIGSEDGVPERRAALPLHRGDAHAARRARRHPRRALRQHGRRPLRGPAVQVAVEQLGDVHADRRLHRVANRQRTPVFGPPPRVDGLRLVDARASYGIGLETFALGFPIHFDWAWRTLLNKDWEDLRFAAERRQLRLPQAAVRDVDWIRLLGSVGSW